MGKRCEPLRAGDQIEYKGTVFTNRIITTTVLGVDRRNQKNRGLNKKNILTLANNEVLYPDHYVRRIKLKGEDGIHNGKFRHIFYFNLRYGDLEVSELETVDTAGKMAASAIRGTQKIFQQLGFVGPLIRKFPGLQGLTEKEKLAISIEETEKKVTQTKTSRKKNTAKKTSK